MPKSIDELNQATDINPTDLFVIRQSGEDMSVQASKMVLVTSDTQFPSSPTLGDECYRTDLDEWYKYNGSVWMQI